jgi:hypothetical protein
MIRTRLVPGSSTSFAAPPGLGKSRRQCMPLLVILVTWSLRTSDVRAPVDLWLTDPGGSASAGFEDSSSWTRRWRLARRSASLAGSAAFATSALNWVNTSCSSAGSLASASLSRAPARSLSCSQ